MRVRIVFLEVITTVVVFVQLTVPVSWKVPVCRAVAAVTQAAIAAALVTY